VALDDYEEHYAVDHAKKSLALVQVRIPGEMGQ
jgi:hypothetical protein